MSVITEAERAVVEAAMAYDLQTAPGWERLMEARHALRTLRAAAPEEPTA